MSIKHTEWVWSHSKSKGIDRLVLLNLADSMNRETGVCWPSNATVAKECGEISVRTVQRSKQKLEAMGELTIESQAGPHGCDLYRLNMDCYEIKDEITLTPHEGGDNLAPRQDVGGDKEWGVGVTSEAQGGDSSVTRTGREPEDKPEKNTSLATLTTPTGANALEKFSEADLRCAGWMLGLIRRVKPDFKEPNLATWAKTIRMMRTLDKRTHADIARVFTWANGDHFWQSNILSPDKFRKQYDRLDIESKKPQRANAGGSKYEQRAQHSVADSASDYEEWARRRGAGARTP